MKRFSLRNNSSDDSWPWLTIALGVGSLLLFLWLGPSPSNLVYSRPAVLQGEIYRLFTGHFVHCDASHLA